MEPTQTAKDYSQLYVPAAIVIAGVIIGAFVMVGLSKGGTPSTGTQPTAKVDIKDVKTDGDPFIGKADAPVTLAYWSDYQCPFCKAVEIGGVQGINITPAMPTLIKNYVDTGKVKIVYKDYPFLSDDSITAALYGRAVWALYPSKYFEWREAMFHSQDEEHGGFGDEASILALIKTIPGMDANKVKADVAANTAAYQAKIDADRAEGTSFGVNGTPGFITGKVLIPGAVELKTFTDAIDPQL
jgi:protein-disulfide isomerase